MQDNEQRINVTHLPLCCSKWMLLIMLMCFIITLLRLVLGVLVCWFVHNVL